MNEIKYTRRAKALEEAQGKKQDLNKKDPAPGKKTVKPRKKPKHNDKKGRKKAQKSSDIHNRVPDPISPGSTADHSENPKNDQRGGSASVRNDTKGG